ncbi:MAG: hypothetical protein JW395_0795 [Nitrospira sp.]|nr:hypothetical protein [Nitrospira sp.]
MYVQHERLFVNPGWQKTAEERAGQILDVQKRSSGFFSSVHLNYLGDRTSYLIIRLWDSSESVTKFATGPEFKALAGSRTPGVYSAPGAMTFYDVAHQEPLKSRPNYALTEEIDLHHGSGRAWEEHEKSVYPLFSSAGGFIGMHNFRYLGDPDHYIRASYWDSLDALDAHFAAQSTKGWYAALPADFLHNPIRRLHYRVTNYANVQE